MQSDPDEGSVAEDETAGKTIPTGKDGVGLGASKDPSTFEPEEDPGRD